MKYKLKLLTDYGTNVLWANDIITSEKFGYLIDNLKEVGLSEETINLNNEIAELSYQILNQIYPPLPSFWSGKMLEYYQSKLKLLYSKILDEIGEEFEIKNKEKEFMNEVIDVIGIDKELKSYLENLARYYMKNSVSNSLSEEDSRIEAKKEYENWIKKEIEYLKNYNNT